MIASKLKRFFWTYCLILFSTILLTIALALSLRPYLGQLFNRWMGYAPTCGCEQYVVLPTNSSSLILFAGLAVITASLLLMTLRVVQTLRQTRRFRLELSHNRVHTTYYQSVPVHLITNHQPIAVCIGYLHPAVYITTGLVRTLNGFELLAVIQHESAHAQRLDPAQRLALMALPNWLPGWRNQLEHYLAGQEILADDIVSDTSAIQSAFVKLVDQLKRQPSVAATFFSTNQARVNHWLGERIPLPTLRIGLVAVTIWLVALFSSYRAFAAEPAAQAVDQCLAVQTMCESNMTYNLTYVVQ